MNRVRTLLRRLRRDTGGLALLEFAFMLPIIMILGLTGAELTNYIVTRMRVSQLALHLADNAARMGTGSQLAAKTISETDINDLFVGGALQAGELNILNRGRIMLYDIEPMANPNNTNKFKIVWQRCAGAKTGYTPSYGIAGQASGTNKDGFGPTGQLANALDDGATMLIEIDYEYQPLIQTALSPSTLMSETASMMIRDRRDLTKIYNSENAPVATC